jgi:hypothetical protein
MELNQRYLSAAIGVVRAHVEQAAAPAEAARRITVEADRALADAEKAAAALDDPPALETVASVFGLSSFERAVLVLCAGVELEADLGRLCGAGPTFGLALAALPDAHWGAAAPGAPLRRWRLIEVGAGASLTASTLRISERCLFELIGTPQLDHDLEAVLEPVVGSCPLTDRQQATVAGVVAAWSAPREGARPPTITVHGGTRSDRKAIVAAAAAAADLELYALATATLPGDAAALEALSRSWEREAALRPAVLLVDVDETHDGAPPSHLDRFVARTHGLLVVSAERRGAVAGLGLEVPHPSAPERRMLWDAALAPDPGRSPDAGALDELAAQFAMGAAEIAAAAHEAAIQPGPAALWQVCRTRARPDIEALAERIEPVATWTDLVLPEPAQRLLRAIVAHVRHQSLVHGGWGFGGRGGRGLGVNALFAGASGTGKTMAAEVVAGELRLDLYRVDLSGVVSKYIGETEKNLARVFDAADAGGAVLLFDEADALFGKRTEVRDSHDRYANIEVSYLLQRMETYRGLAILTSNMQSSLDPAFLRRLRFVVAFPFPDEVQRVELWRRSFPVATPTEGLGPDVLARLQVSGGAIANIALASAFLAASEGSPVRMTHVHQAALDECTKQGKAITPGELEGWLA